MTTKITGANIDTIANTGVKWNAVTVADGSTQLTASAGNGYFLDTNAGVIEVFLPASPTRGDTVILSDYAGHFALNNVLVNTGGQNIDSTEVAGEFKLTTNNVVVELVYVDANLGWLVKENEAKSGLSLIQGGDYNPATYIAATGGTVSTIGDFKYHAFTGDSNFVVSAVGNPKGSSTVTALVVAGGGAGQSNGGSGGGAGGLRNLPLAVCAQTYPITVGGGGTGGPPTNTSTAGSNSIFSTITSAGGGRGTQSSPKNGGNGGSGGGAGGNGGCAGTGGTGNTPPVSPPQGNDGGSHGPVPNFNAGAGGGGSSQAGAAGPNNGSPGTPGGHGGNGTDVTPDFPAPLGGTPAGFYAGGGGGGGNDDGPQTSSDTPNAPGGGGEGAGGPSQTAGDGTANTGGGGGGAPTGGSVAGSGGSGIVIIKYKFQN